MTSVRWLLAELTAAEAERDRLKEETRMWMRSNARFQMRVKEEMDLRVASQVERDKLKAEATIPDAVYVGLKERAEQAESSLTAARDALRQLVEKWRRHDIGNEADWCIFIMCANDLEAALHASSVQTTETP